MKEPSNNFKSLLWIGVFSNHIHDYVDKMIHSYHLPFEDARTVLLDGKEKIDGVIMTMLHKPVEILAIKEIASLKNIPLFLYTVTFEHYAKELVLKLGVDEYWCGSDRSSLMKRIESIQKLKAYKKRSRSLLEKAAPLRSKIFQPAIKRTFDILSSSLALLVFSPVFVLISLIILFGSRGPLLEISKSVGFGYKTFDLYKFRTSKNENNSESSFWFNHLGQFLRASGLSELPTLFNVLKGDMSIVGSKPLTLADAEKLTEDHAALRFMTHAGFIGSWRERYSLIANGPA